MFEICLFVWFGFYGVSTLISNLMLDPFLYKKPFQNIQLSIRTQFNCLKHFYFMLLSLVKQFYFKQFSLI